VLVSGGWYGSVVVGRGCWGRARPSMRPVRLYLTPALTALYLGNQNPPKMPYAVIWASRLDIVDAVHWGAGVEHSWVTAQADDYIVRPSTY
jgi:hypothetical protein